MRISDWSSDVCSSDLLRGERVQHRTGDVERARVPGHGVAVGATLVDARGVFGQRQHRQRVLAGVERLRVRLHVRRSLAFEAGVVDARQGAGGAQAGLARVYQPPRTARLAKPARGGSEAPRPGAAPVAFAPY